MVPWDSSPLLSIIQVMRPATVDGRNTANQLIWEISHYLQGLYTIPGGWEWDFFHQQYQIHLSTPGRFPYILAPSHDVTLEIPIQPPENQE